MSKTNDRFVEEFIDALQYADDKYKFKNIIQSTIKKIGYSDFDISEPKSNHKIDFLVSTLPTDIPEIYKSESMHKNDFVLECLANRKSPLFDARAYKYYSKSPYPGPSVPQSLRPHELMKGYGFNNSYTIPIDTQKTDMRLAFSVLDKDRNEIEFENHTLIFQDRLDRMAKIACDFLVSKSPLNSIIGVGKLTSRQSTVLAQISKGKSHTKVANMLGISKRTVDTHVTDIKNALNASNTPHAVYIAMERGLLRNNL